MADRPLLKLPNPTRGARVKKKPAFAPLHKPDRGGLDDKFGPKFRRLAALLDREDQTLALRDNPEQIAPERALVFEIAGSVSDFYKAVKKVEGLEFLLDEEIEHAPDEDFYHTKTDQTKDDTKAVRGCLYMLMPDVRALKELTRLWDKFKNNQPFDEGFSPWKTVFSQLRDLRQWGPQDRISADTIEYWERELESNPDQPVRFEIEFWFREQPENREAAFQNLSSQIKRVGGAIIHHTDISDIRYHAALVNIPAQEVRKIIDNRQISLAIVDDIMFIKPQTVAQCPVAYEEEAIEGQATESEFPVRDTPIIAVIDGVPVQNHRLLAGRIVVEDPDGLESSVPAIARSHGTAMASLILYGDRNAPQSPSDEKLLVYPVLEAKQNMKGEWYECTSLNKLPIDIIYRAFKRIKEGDDGQPAIAPGALIFNHSLGDNNRRFAGKMSAWARLLDHLSYKYKILIITSAGNIAEPLKIDSYPNTAAFESDAADERAKKILAALDAAKAHRSLLSPAEALNVITVGGWHNDNFSSAPNSPHAFDPFPAKNVTNITSAVGLGYKRGIKPDLVFDGGRELVLPQSLTDGFYLRPANAGAFFGQLCAAPDNSNSGKLDREKRYAGTSNATALITKNAAKIYRSLEEISDGEIGTLIPQDSQAVVIKGLLIHSCYWGENCSYIQSVVGPADTRKHVQRNENAIRYLGHGYPNIERVIECTKNRATLFGYGSIGADDSDIFEIDLPPSLEGKKEFRRLTMTAAWLTPTNSRHQNYRAAALEIKPAGDGKYSLGVERISAQPNHNAIARGTSYHVTLEGKDAVPYVDNGKIKVSVSCKASAGILDGEVPYALVVTIEVAENSTINVYEEIVTVIRSRAQPVRPRTRA